MIAAYMKLACSTYSTSFRSDDFSSFKNSTKFKILIVQIFKLSLTLTQLRHNLLHIVLSGLHTANLRSQIRVGKLQKKWQTRTFTRQTHVQLQYAINCKMGNLVQWHSSRTVKQKKRRWQKAAEK